MIFYIWKLLYNIIRRVYNYIKQKLFGTKTKTITLEHSSSIHCEIFNIIPNEDIEAKRLIKFIIENSKYLHLICNNPNCGRKLVDGMYCIFDSYYCSMECQNNTYRLFFNYWKKIAK